MKISILLPYIIFHLFILVQFHFLLKIQQKISKYKSNIIVYGNTKYKKTFPVKYSNITLSNFKLQSKSKQYVSKFIQIEKDNPSRSN